MNIFRLALGMQRTKPKGGRAGFITAAWFVFWHCSDKALVLSAEPAAGFTPCDNPELVFFLSFYLKEIINESDDQFCNLQLPSSFEAI